MRLATALFALCASIVIADAPPVAAQSTTAPANIGQAITGQATPSIGPTPEQAKEHPQLVFAMTPQRIEEAMAYGYRDKSPIAIYTVLAGLRGDKRQVAFASTPFSRVVAAAYAARTKYQPFTAADVTPDLIAPELHIYAQSKLSGPTILDVEAIVIMPRGEKDPANVIRPTRTAVMTEQYKNLAGATFEGHGLLAVFPLTAFVTDHQVRIVRRGDETETRAKIEVKREFR